MPLYEPLGAFWNWAYSSDVSRITAASRETIIVDLGYFTTDLNVVNRGVLNPELGGSLQVAMREVYRGMGKAILKATSNTYSDLDLEMAVLDEWPLFVKGIPFDVLSYLLPSMESVAAKIIAWIQGLVDVANSVILVAGGGAQLLLPHLRLGFPKTELILAHEPQLANARGYFHVAKFLSGEVKRA